VSEKREAKCVLKMFPNREWNFGGLKTLIGENSCSGGVDPRP